MEEATTTTPTLSSEAATESYQWTFMFQVNFTAQYGNMIKYTNYFIHGNEKNHGNWDISNMHFVGKSMWTPRSFTSNRRSLSATAYIDILDNSVLSALWQQFG